MRMGTTRLLQFTTVIDVTGFFYRLILRPCAGSHRKGKYAPLRMLASRLGATRLLQLQPGLVPDMLRAMRFESVCPANAGLLEAVLGSLRHECMESAGATRGPPQDNIYLSWGMMSNHLATRGHRIAHGERPAQ